MRTLLDHLNLQLPAWSVGMGGGLAGLKLASSWPQAGLKLASSWSRRSARPVALACSLLAAENAGVNMDSESLVLLPP